MIHTTASGAITPCRNRACADAPPEEHYATIGEASRALALEALWQHPSFDLTPLPEDWGRVMVLDQRDLYSQGSGAS